MSVARPFITPTYQSNLNAAIHEVIERLNEGRELTWQTWEALKTLYCTLPTKVRDACNEEYKKIGDYVDRRTASITDHGLFARSKEWQEIVAFLYERNWRFYTTIMKALEDNKYLDVKPAQVTTNVPPQFFEQPVLEGQQTNR